MVLRLLTLTCVQGIEAPSDIASLLSSVLTSTFMGCAMDPMALLQRV